MTGESQANKTFLNTAPLNKIPSSLYKTPFKESSFSFNEISINTEPTLEGSFVRKPHNFWFFSRPENMSKIIQNKKLLFRIWSTVGYII
jgi:hypothetical protein